MDYEKMYKKDLLVEVLKLEKQVKEKDALEATLNASKKTVTKLRGELNDEKRKTAPEALKIRIQREIKNEKEKYAPQIEKYEKEIVELKQTNDAKIASLEARHNAQINGYKQALEQNSNVEQLKARVKQLNDYMGAHGSLLKTLQGALDTALGYNEYLSNEVQKTNT